MGGRVASESIQKISLASCGVGVFSFESCCLAFDKVCCIYIYMDFVVAKLNGHSLAYRMKL